MKKNVMVFDGGLLRSLREARRLTQLDLAKLINNHTNTIVRYESGLIVPSLETLIRLAEIFNVTPNDFLGFKATDTGPLYNTVLSLKTQIDLQAEELRVREEQINFLKKKIDVDRKKKQKKKVA